MVLYEVQRTGNGCIRRVFVRRMKIVEVVDDEWYRIVPATPDTTSSFCARRPKIQDAYVKIREWHRGCDRVNVYTRVEE